MFSYLGKFYIFWVLIHISGKVLLVFEYFSKIFSGFGIFLDLYPVQNLFQVLNSQTDLNSLHTQKL